MREQERKKLKTSAINQLSSFQELAIFDDEHMNPEFDFDLLEATNFEDEDIRKIVDHPFLRLIDGNRYQFSYDFLGPYFRALSIAKSLGDSAVSEASPDLLFRLVDVMAREPDGKGYISEQLCGLLEPTDVKKVAGAARKILSVSKEAASFLLHICKTLIDNDSQVVTGSERADSLFGAITEGIFTQNRLVRGWAFYGVLDRPDFQRDNIRTM